MGNLFKGRMQVPYYYSCFGYSRGGGKTWHGGQDVVGLDSDAILMPDYDGKSISGTVVTARKVEKSTGEPNLGVGLVRVREAGREPDPGRGQLPVLLPQ